jgi:hypothetical protein
MKDGQTMIQVGHLGRLLTAKAGHQHAHPKKQQYRQRRLHGRSFELKMNHSREVWNFCNPALLSGSAPSPNKDFDAMPEAVLLKTVMLVPAPAPTAMQQAWLVLSAPTCAPASQAFGSEEVCICVWGGEGGGAPGVGGGGCSHPAGASPHARACAHARPAPPPDRAPSYEGST